MTNSQTLAWTDDTPQHPKLSRHPEAPLVETRASKVIQAPLETVFAHFFGSEPRLRLELHKDHVKQYHIHHETADTLDYEFVFEAYGTRNYGRATEVATRPHRIDVEVLEGPLRGQSVVTLFREVPGGTEVTQVNRVWPGTNDLMVKVMGNRLKSRLVALAGVHLEQHRHDLEGLGRFQDKFSQQAHEEREKAKANPLVDLLKTTRAITLPIILLPIVGAAAVAHQQGTYSALALALTLVGGAASILAANVLNDLWDYRFGADQSARAVPGAIETGSGAFVEGRWSTRKGWAVTAILATLALACGVALAALSTPWVLAYAAGGALIAYAYIGPPFPLAYKGRGLGELGIFAAFGVLPVLGGVLAHGGHVTPQAWAVACLFGLSSTLVLYHHHFLHWQADLAARKMSPVAALGPRRGAAVGLALALVLAAAVLAAAVTRLVPAWTAIAAAPSLLLVAPHAAILRGDTTTPAMTRVAGAAFAVMALTGLALDIALWF